MPVSQNPLDTVPQLWYKIQSAAIEYATLKGKTITGPTYLSDWYALNNRDQKSVILHKVLAIVNSLRT